MRASSKQSYNLIMVAQLLKPLLPLVFVVSCLQLLAGVGEAAQLEEVLNSLFESREQHWQHGEAIELLNLASLLVPASNANTETVERWQLAKKILQLNQFDLRRCSDRNRRREYDAVLANKYLDLSRMTPNASSIAYRFAEGALSRQVEECRQYVAGAIVSKTNAMDPLVKKRAEKLIVALARHRKRTKEDQIKQASLEVIEQTVELTKSKKKLKEPEGVEAFNGAYSEIILDTCNIVTDELAEEASIISQGDIQAFIDSNTHSWTNLEMICEMILADVRSFRAKAFDSAVGRKSMLKKILH